jgi:hypothetical protein
MAPGHTSVSPGDPLAPEFPEPVPPDGGAAGEQAAIANNTAAEGARQLQAEWRGGRSQLIERWQSKVRT